MKPVVLSFHTKESSECVSEGMEVHQPMALLQCIFSVLVLECHLTLSKLLIIVVSLCDFSTVMQRAKMHASIVADWSLECSQSQCSTVTHHQGCYYTQQLRGTANSDVHKNLKCVLIICGTGDSIRMIQYSSKLK